jgi:hypothetical protein
MVVGLALGLFLGLAAGLVFGVAADLVFGVAFCLFFGLAAGLVLGLALGLFFGVAEGLVFGLALGLVFGLALGLFLGLAAGLVFGLAAGFVLGLPVSRGLRCRWPEPAFDRFVYCRQQSVDVVVPPGVRNFGGVELQEVDDGGNKVALGRHGRALNPDRNDGQSETQCCFYFKPHGVSGLLQPASARLVRVRGPSLSDEKDDNVRLRYLLFNVIAESGSRWNGVEVAEHVFAAVSVD